MKVLMALGRRRNPPGNVTSVGTPHAPEKALGATVFRGCYDPHSAYCVVNKYLHMKAELPTIQSQLCDAAAIRKHHHTLNNPISHFPHCQARDDI